MAAFAFAFAFAFAQGRVYREARGMRASLAGVPTEEVGLMAAV